MKKLIYIGLALLAASAQARDYSVSVKGIAAGKANLLISNKQGQYKAQLTLYPNMMAKMFNIDDMREVAQGKFISGHAFPNQYKREELTGKPLMSVKFLKGKVNVNKEGKKKSFAINKMGQDPLSQVVQIQHDLKVGKLASSYYTVTDKAQYHSVVKRDGNRVDLVRAKRKGDKISLWFDDSHQLTRMRKVKKDKVVFDMKQR